MPISDLPHNRCGVLFSDGSNLKLEPNDSHLGKKKPSRRVVTDTDKNNESNKSNKSW